LTSYRVGLAHVNVQTDQKDHIADLLVGADGYRSLVRGASDLGWTGWSYPQTGLVATIHHEFDHHGRAVEHFLPSGPFAILPLLPIKDTDGQPIFRSSLVWTERTEAVADLMSLPVAALTTEIERRFGLELGDLALEGEVQSYPLGFGMARSFVGKRVALLGDAAHIIHPIAGQGLNLGLMDASALADTLIDAVRLGLDIGDEHTLLPYQQARRFDTLVMGAVTDGLNRLFSNDVLLLRLARDLGLGLVDRLPMLKAFLIGRAAGVRGSKAVTDQQG
jgi:2-octaprenyl-6-methoxyphenol hydroxylase